MDDRDFDSIAKRAAGGSSRRTLLKALFGIGAVTATGAVVHGQADAARRGFSGPKFPWDPTPTPIPVCLEDGEYCDLSDQNACCSQKCIYNPLSPSGGYCIP